MSSATTNTKTLYTPVFFSSSEPPRGSRSTNSANLKIPSAYLNALSRTHIALAQIVQEVPSSRPGSPTEDADGSYPDSSTQERVSALRARVQEAWVMADGNPADGKWTLLTHLLRTGVTRGRAGRWAGTRADLKAPDAPDGGWINAVTEAEWGEWEKRVGLKDKVENWKMRLQTHEELDSQVIKDTQHTSNVEPSSKSSLQEEAKKADSTASQPKLKPSASESAVITNSHPLKNNSLFGFAVVKRSNPTAAAVGKKPPANRLPKETAPSADKAPEIQKITDIPESSFLPPSFLSSQVMTSTPKAKPISISSDKHKPEPIPFTASPSDGPLSSPRVTKVYGRPRQDQSLEKSTSLSAIPPVPTTPTRNRDDATNKRSANGDLEDDRAVKKARTMPSLHSSPVAASAPPKLSTPNNEQGRDLPFPTTPRRQQLPTLTELLASAKKGKKKSHSPKGLKPKSAAIEPTTKPASSDKAKFRFPSPPPVSDPHFEDNPYMLDPYAISVNHDALELGIDLDASPTKSLSSLAGSDSEDEDEDDEDRQQALGLGVDLSPSSFHPYITSTQHPHHDHEGGRKGQQSSSFPGRPGFGGYNSQFDVAGQVDKVDKLLEKDVDYEGWLRDPSAEREGVQVEESP